MFGYILPNLESLQDSERARYRAVYCGVCRSIKQRYGQISRLATSFDLTFMAMVFDSLYEPQESCGNKCCPVHPTELQEFAISEYTQYAADLSVVFAYHKLLDDWHDDKKVKSRLGATALWRSYRKAKERIPVQCTAIEQALLDI